MKLDVLDLALERSKLRLLRESSKIFDGAFFADEDARIVKGQNDSVVREMLAKEPDAALEEVVSKGVEQLLDLPAYAFDIFTHDIPHTKAMV